MKASFPSQNDIKYGCVRIKLTPAAARATMTLEATPLHSNTKTMKNSCGTTTLEDSSPYGQVGKEPKQPTLYVKVSYLPKLLFYILTIVAIRKIVVYFYVLNLTQYDTSLSGKVDILNGLIEDVGTRV
jgi:hypothetical protein